MSTIGCWSFSYSSITRQRRKENSKSIHDSWGDDHYSKEIKKIRHEGLLYMTQGRPRWWNNMWAKTWCEQTKQVHNGEEEHYRHKMIINSRVCLVCSKNSKKSRCGHLHEMVTTVSGMNTWSTVGGTAWVNLGGVALLEEACRLRI